MGYKRITSAWIDLKNVLHINLNTVLIEKQLNDKSQYKRKNISLMPSFLLIHVSFLLWLAASSSTETHSLFPGIYQLSPAESQSVSVSQPLPSTSMCYHAPLSLLVTLSPPCCFITSNPPTTTSTRRPSGNRVNPKPIRGGLTWATEDSQFPFAPLLSGGWN